MSENVVMKVVKFHDKENIYFQIQMLLDYSYLKKKTFNDLINPSIAS